MINITVKYRDGGEDFFPGIISHSAKGGVLIIEDVRNRFVHIILDVITFFTVEEV